MKLTKDQEEQIKHFNRLYKKYDDFLIKELPCFNIRKKLIEEMGKISKEIKLLTSNKIENIQENYHQFQSKSNNQPTHYVFS